MQLYSKNFTMDDLIVTSYDRETQYTYDRLIKYTEHTGLSKIFLEDTGTYPGLWSYESSSIYLSSLQVDKTTHHSLLEGLREDDNKLDWYPFIISSEKRNKQFILNIFGYSAGHPSSVPAMPKRLSNLFVQHTFQYFKVLTMYELKIIVAGDVYYHNKDSDNLILLER